MCVCMCVYVCVYAALYLPKTFRKGKAQIPGLQQGSPPSAPQYPPATQVYTQNFKVSVHRYTTIHFWCVLMITKCMKKLGSAFLDVIYLHACIHTYIHTYIHAYIHACMHTYMHTYMQTLICVHECIFVCTYIRICMYVRVYDCVRERVCVCGV